VDPFTVVTAVIAAVGVSAAWWYRRRARRAEAYAADLDGRLQAECYAARHDPLTGLPNRRAFWELGTAQLKDPTGQPLVAVLIDLDDFKRVNDTLGHAAGDKVLIILAQRLAAYAAGDLIARIGGDEFAGLLAASITADGAVYPDSRELARTLATPVRIAGRNVQVTASIGVATVHGPADLAEVLHHADAAMYRVKNLQRSTTSTRAIRAVHPAIPAHDFPAPQPIASHTHAIAHHPLAASAGQ